MAKRPRSTMQQEAEDGVLFDIQYVPPPRPQATEATTVEYLIVHTDGEPVGALWGAENNALGFIQTLASGSLGEAIAGRWRDRIFDAYLHADHIAREVDSHMFLMRWLDNIQGGGAVSLEGPYKAPLGKMRQQVELM